jgi:hypothetical protein
MKKAEKGNITIVYYTSNFLETANPYFLRNTSEQLVKAADGLPIIIVSQKPIFFLAQISDIKEDSTNIVVGEKEGIVGRSHLNIYRQILIGAKAAKTKYVALAEDDILYSFEHFHDSVPEDNRFLYDMNKVSLFSWSKPPIFSFRHNRKVINQLIAPRELLIEALEERFKRVEELLKTEPEEQIIKRWGDLTRYEERLGVTVRKADTFMSTCPSIVFSHEFAFGYLNQGQRKALGDLRIVELAKWGRADQIIKLYDKNL